LSKDPSGNIDLKPKGGTGPGEPTGIHVNDLGGVFMTSEIAVAMRLTGQDFSLEKVTLLLGVSPIKTWCLGDTVQNSLLKRKHDGWEFALPVQAVLDLEAQLCAWLDLFESRRHSMLEVCDRFGLEVEAGHMEKNVDGSSCVIWAAEREPPCLDHSASCTRVRGIMS
jgi:hypothetical protein